MNIPDLAQISNWERAEKGHKFMINTYIYYIIAKRKSLARILDEYIYWMYQLFGTNGYRIRKLSMNYVDDISELHLANFRRMIDNVKDNIDNDIDDVTDDDIDDTDDDDNRIQLIRDYEYAANKLIVIKFYKKLFLIVDKALKETYYYKRAITKREHHRILRCFNSIFKNKKHLPRDYIWVEFIIPHPWVRDPMTFEEELKKNYPGRLIYVKFDGYEWKVLMSNFKSLYIDDMFPIVNLCTDEVLYFEFEMVDDDKRKLELTIVFNEKYSES